MNETSRETHVVDSSEWENPITYTRNGEIHPPPVPLRGGIRQVTPDPYTQPDNPHVRRRFGR